MVDISRPLTSANHPSKFAPDVRLPYMIETTVSAEQMIAKKGTALANADVFDIFRVPAGTAVLHVWAKCTKAFAGSSTDLTLSVGYTGGTTNLWVNAWDFDAATVGQFATPGAGKPASGVLGALDTANAGTASVVSMLTASQTGTWTSGEITFYALCIDLSDRDNSKSGVVALGS